MGDIKKYECGCGYQAELALGAGIRSRNPKMMEHFFPEEYESLSKAGGSLRLEQRLGQCRYCKKIAAVVTLVWDRPDGKTECFYQKCDTCQKEFALLEDEEQVKCPVCGKLMKMEEMGIWD